MALSSDGWERTPPDRSCPLTGCVGCMEGGSQAPPPSLLSGLGEGCRDGGPGECWGEGGNAEFSLEQVESGVPGISQKFRVIHRKGETGGRMMKVKR